MEIVFQLLVAAVFAFILTKLVLSRIRTRKDKKTPRPNTGGGGGYYQPSHPQDPSEPKRKPEEEMIQ